MLTTPRSPDVSPFAAPPQLARVLLAILALLLCYHTYYSLSMQKSLGWDASLGFLTLQSSLEHGDFNRIHHPDSGDLTKDRAEFIAWWTPGQYLIPHWVSSALGTDIGMSLRVVAVLCSTTGILGLCLLYNKLGFSRPCVYLGLIVVCSQDFFLKGSRTYLGGDLLLFSAAPYLALGVLSIRTPFHWRALLAALGCIFALFLKASALTLFLGLVLYLALEIHGWPGDRTQPGRARGIQFRRLLVLGVILAMYILVAQLVYLSKGVTISSSARYLDSFSPDRWWGVAVALAGPLYGAFSVFEPYTNTSFFIPMACLCLLVVGILGSGFKTAGLPDYRRMLVAHYLAFVLFFSYAYLAGMSISFEPRHFRMAGLLLVPGLVHVLLSYRHQTLVAAAIVTLSLASVAIYHREYHAGSRLENSSSRWGIRQPLTNASLEAMHRIDDTRVARNTVVFNGFGACPALLLEFNNGRKIQDDNWIYQAFKYSGRSTTPMPWYRGACDSIVFLIPKNNTWYFGPTLEEIARTFERPLRVAPCFENDELIIYAGSVR